MNLYCYNCNTNIKPPLLCINYCNSCYHTHIVTYHDKMIDSALRTEQRIIALREELDLTRSLIDEIRREAKRCGFRLGSDVEETSAEGGQTSENDNREGGDV